MFEGSWQWVAMASDLPAAGTSIVITVAGRQWILRRGADGAVRALRNVCLHRGARLCTGPGRGALRCPYHGWTYDDDGVLIGVPFRGGFEDDLRPGLDALGAGRVEPWGPALFFNPDPAAGTLHETLGPLHAQLDPIFTAMSEVVDTASVDIAANWKIVMENALEAYHVGFIHGDSIHPLGFQVTHTGFHGAHSVCHFSAPPAKRKLRLISYAFPDRPIALDGYLHAHVFPASTVATAYGNFFVLTRTEPLAIDRTRLHWTMVSTRHGARSEAAATAAALMDESNKAFLRRTFEEDAAICARVHAGCAEATTRGYLGDQEDRVAAFEHEVVARMGLVGTH